MALTDINTKTAGAEAVLRCLLAEGVDTVFGYPGGAIMPVYDALYDYKDHLQHILSRHEQGAIHAAQGYARVSGKTGVVLATSGPGATNLITGLADAQINSTPLVCITGQVASHLLGTDAFQETDVVGISMPVTKWNCQITRAEDIAPMMAKAFYIATSGRPGPVLVDITKDAQFEETSFTYQKCEHIRSYSPKPKLNVEKLEAAAALINAAKKPLVLVGQGILLGNAEKELRAFIEKAGLPAAATLLGLSALPVDHPLYVGYLGMHGNYAPNLKTNECDVLIALGMRFDDRVTGNTTKYAKQAKIIHVDIDAAELNKIIPADVALHADAKEALHEILPLIETKKHSAWLNEFRQADEEELDLVVRPNIAPKTPEITMGQVIHLLSEITQGDAIVVTDVGQHQMITSRYFKYKSPRTNVTSGGLGTMGFALPAALGAKLGAPEKEVFAVIGDGGFQMTLQELGTLMQFKIPVKIIILNNEFLGMVRQWQEMFFDSRYSFTEMHNPNFIQIAEGYALKARKVTEPADLKEALLEVCQAKEAYLLEVKVKKEDNVFPMIPTGASVSDILLR